MKFIKNKHFDCTKILLVTMTTLNEEGKKVIEDLRIASFIEPDVGTISKEIEFMKQAAAKYKNLHCLSFGLDEISDRYLSHVNPENIRNAMSRLKSNGYRGNSALLYRLVKTHVDAYIIETCVRSKKLPEEFLDLFDEAAKEFNELKNSALY